MRVFLSYCWADRDEAEVIDAHFSKKKYAVVRDIRDLGFKENIKDYMRKIRDTDYAILIVSDSFLKSSNCMFEVLELLESHEYEKRIIPVLVDGVNIFNPQGKLGYSDFWKNRLSELKTLNLEKKSEDKESSIEIEIDDCRRILGSLDDFLSHLSTHFHPFFRELRRNNFKPIEQYLSPIETKVFSRTHFLGHPIGLYIISLMAFWDRFSYYGMRSILVLVLILPIVEGGLGLSDNKAFEIYLAFMAGMYLLSVFGGLIGDFVLDRKRTQLLGMFILTIGFFIMSHSSSFMHISLAVIALGTGLMKPNSIALISDLYHDQDYLRDDGFSIFYTLISAGAIISVLIVTYIFDKYGHETGFFIAGLGMLGSLGIYLIGSRYIIAGIHSRVKMDSQIGLGSAVKFKSFKMLGVAFLLSALFWLSYEFWYSFMFASEDQLINSREYFDYQSIVNGLLILVLGIPLSYVIGRKFRKVSHGLYLSKLAVSLVLSLIATTVLVIGLSDLNLSLVISFLAISTLAELFFQPTMLAYVTWIAPKKFLATSVSFLNISIFLTSQIGGLLFNRGIPRSSEIVLLYTIQFFLLGVISYVIWRGRKKNWELFSVR